MRTMPIQVFDTKTNLNEYLTTIQAKEHYKHKKHYGTPDGKVLKAIKKSDKRYALYEVYGAVRKDGYVCLCIDGTSITKHRFIMECFNGKKPKGLEIDHFNNNKQDNKLSNLMYVTHKQNMEKFWRERRIKNATF